MGNAGEDSREAIARDVAEIQRIGSVPSILQLICKHTGLGFAAVARVTDANWTACAVQDNIGFGLTAGSELPVETTLCLESRQTRTPVIIEHASQDPVYRDHHTPRIYGIESYVSVPIVRMNGTYFGNLCAIDPKPAKVADERTKAMFELFASLIAMQLDADHRIVQAEDALLTERESAKLREEFIAVLGHDLRNPVMTIHASAELLLKGPDHVDVVKIANRLRAASKRMAKLLDDVLDFARGRLGSGLGIVIEAANGLEQALLNVVGEIRQTHPGRVVSHEIRIDRPVQCDTGRIQQLLGNLLSNALTHGSAADPVRVEAKLDGRWLTLSVQNFGEPIHRDSLAKVFEPYWRPASSKPGGGLGLGLYICAEIAKAHGGTMDVRSSREAGTCFTASLPTAIP